jgi:RimJ/RimL family protein N-acetyltransferase
VTEAVDLITEYAFTSLCAHRVEISCDECNHRSAAVAQRLGFKQEARLRNNGKAVNGRLRTTLIFALTPDDRQK